MMSLSFHFIKIPIAIRNIITTTEPNTSLYANKKVFNFQQLAQNKQAK